MGGQGMAKRSFAVHCRRVDSDRFSRPDGPVPGAGRHRLPGVRAAARVGQSPQVPARDCWSRKSTKQPKVVRSISASARPERFFLTRMANKTPCGRVSAADAFASRRGPLLG